MTDHATTDDPRVILADLTPQHLDIMTRIARGENPTIFPMMRRKFVIDLRLLVPTEPPRAARLTPGRQRAPAAGAGAAPARADRARAAGSGGARRGADRSGSMTRERPILFSSPMVRAILDGRKTQTRRLVKHEHIAEADVFSRTADDQGRWEFGIEGEGGVFAHGDYIRCPYGEPGDTLWVREEHYRYGHWEAVTGERQRTRTGRQRWRFVADLDEIRYEAPATFRRGRHHKDPATSAWHKRLARFMPRRASRITLELTEVRVQRLQEISEEDARAEGVTPFRHDPEGDCWTARTDVHRSAFEYLWNEIHGWHPNAFAADPFVWALTFRRLT